MKHCLGKDLKLPTLCHNWYDLRLRTDEREVAGCRKVLWVRRVPLWRLRKQWMVPWSPLLAARLECALKVFHDDAVAAWENAHGGPLGGDVVEPHPQREQVTTGCRVKVTLRYLPVNVAPAVPLSRHTEHTHLSASVTGNEKRVWLTSRCASCAATASAPACCGPG